MDWKKAMDDLKAQADGVVKKAEAEYTELKARLDKDGDGVPDALKGAMDKARELAASAEAKLGEMKASLDKDGDGKPDVIERLGQQANHAVEQARAKAVEVAKAVQEKLGTKPSDNA
jgi:hypothetical protein